MVEQPSDAAAGLWLGDDSWATGGSLASMGITHRLQCNMRDADSRRWMSIHWMCDCEACVPRASTNALDELVACPLSAVTDGDVQTVEPPPAPHQAQRPVSLEMSVDETSGGVIHAYLPLFDDEPFARDHAGPLLRAGARFIHEIVDLNGGRIYVHCEKGCSRSPSVVAQYLVEFRGYTLLQAAEFLKARRCRTSPNGGFLDALLRNERQAASGGESDPAQVQAAFRRPWLDDFRAGLVRPQPVDRIL